MDSGYIGHDYGVRLSPLGLQDSPVESAGFPRYSTYMDPLMVISFFFLSRVEWIHSGVFELQAKNVLRVTTTDCSFIPGFPC